MKVRCVHYLRLYEILYSTSTGFTFGLKQILKYSLLLKSSLYTAYINYGA